MDERLWKVIAIALGAIVFACLILIIIFGVRLSNNIKIIEKETLIRLSAQEKKLRDTFQKEKETEDFQYTADAEFGSFQFSYPRVWSTNITKELGASEEFIFLGDPSLINIDNKKLGLKTPVALRVILYTEKYEDMVLKSQKDNKKMTMTETDVEVSGLPGKKFTGIPPKATAAITYTLVKFRDKTLYIGTDDSAKYEDQYNKILSSFYLNR